MTDIDSRVYIARKLAPLLAEYSSDGILPRDRAQWLLSATLTLLEQLMREICNKYSKLRLLTLLRTLAPPRIFTGYSSTPSLDVAPSRILTVAALKHGSRILEGTLGWQISGYHRITEQQRRDCLELVILAQYYNQIERIWYAFGNGVEIAIRDGEITHVVNDVQRRLALLENQRLEYNTSGLLAPSAILADFDVYNSLKMDSLFVLSALAVVSSEKSTSSGPIMLGIPEVHEGRLFETNFVSLTYSLDNIQNLAYILKDHFVKLYGINFRTFSYLLSAFSLLQIDGNMHQPEFFADFSRTGLGLFQVEPTLAFLTDHLNKLSSHTVAVPSPWPLVRRFTKTVVLSDRRCQDLDLHGNWLPYLFYQFDNTYVADWMNLFTVLNSILLTVSDSGDAKNMKGSRFEQDLAKWISARDPGAKPLFKPNQKLKLNGNIVGEIDLSFVCGAVAYVIECKAYKMSRYCYRGDPDAIYSRWCYTEEWLSQAIKTARVLAANPRGDNYRLPDGIRYVVPLVCSLHVEPVYMIDDRHFVNEQIPRICTPLELLSLLSIDLSPASVQNTYTYIRQSPNETP